MPPGRRGRPAGSSNSNNPRAAQSTLAFGRNNKITKPSLPPPSKKASKPTTDKQVKDVATIIDEGKVVPTQKEAEENKDAKPKTDDVVNEDQALAERREKAIAIREIQQVKAEESSKEAVVVDAAEEKARKVPEAAVKRYWREKEAERKAPRVHQQALSLHEKILRHFDLSSQYGPCVGIPRVRRWKRAEGLGLRPPIEVLAVLVREGEREGMEKAFMDGLLGGSSVVG